MDKDVKGHYKINGNNYSFSEEVVCATDKIYITVCNVNCVNYSNLKINNLKTNHNFESVKLELTYHFYLIQ